MEVNLPYMSPPIVIFWKQAEPKRIIFHSKPKVLGSAILVLLIGGIYNI